MRILVYALGGGNGHRLRGRCVAHALTSAGHDVTLLLPNVKVEPTASTACDWREVRLDAPNDVAAHRRLVDAHIERCDHVVVDTFPEGLLGELRDIDVGAASVLLRLRQDSGTRAFLDEAGRYRVRVDLEPSLNWLPVGFATHTLPPVIASAASKWRQFDNREIIEASEGGRNEASVAPTVVHLAAGDDDELASFFSRLLPPLRARGFDVSSGITPASTTQPHVVIGASGYTLTHELRVAGVHHIAIARSRRFDDQRRRALTHAHVPTSPEDVLRLVAELCVTTRPDRIDAASPSAIVAAVLASPLTPTCALSQMTPR